MNIEINYIESPPCYVLTMGELTLMFETRDEAEEFIRFLRGNDDEEEIVKD
ncbi:MULTISPECIES: hypothetical protein [Pseudomonas fluorescens group]|uniref:Uncharacterized protein n=1 Tax=Pseudomonas fluorescens TaxID=294 RepID=A0A0D0TE05_PSEFL|nr:MULTISPECIES: hypothetical protein [Pseudomonas fluorescens group]AZE58594.1 hypothetical protein C4K02_0199 [Pseudomonas synxantha]KIR21736.1 hypothetical protein PFLU3_27720 [Pseudomonas fluorescens]